LFEVLDSFQSKFHVLAAVYGHRLDTFQQQIFVYAIDIILHTSTNIKHHHQHTFFSAKISTGGDVFCSDSSIFTIFSS
jgi:hypothetical protein